MNRGWVTALATVAVLAIAATPAGAAKSDKGEDSELGKLKTAATIASSATTGLTTAIAECPGKTKVVGGGFVVPPATGGEILNTIESRREGKKAWRVSAYRIDGGGVGPTLNLTAEAYCRSGLGKLTERSDSVTIAGPVNPGSPVATCGVGKTPLAGGFSIGSSPNPNQLHVSVYDNLMAGKVGWVHRAINLVPTPNTLTFTSFVYCQQRGEKAPKTTTGVGVVPGPVASVGTADTAPCSGKRDAFVGGFQLPPFVNSPSGFLLPIESRHVDKGWHIAASRLAGTAAASITAYGYCS